MTAHDILTLTYTPPKDGDVPETAKVSALTSAWLLLPMLSRSADGRVEVTDQSGETMGVVDASAMLRALSEMLGDGDDDTSWVEISVATSEYSASAVARAVEDVDANILDMLTSVDPADARRLHVSLRVSHVDPSAVVRSLERYGYQVRSSSSLGGEDYDRARRNLSELELYLNM